MIVFPAMDLYGGEIVRLSKGDFAARTVYSADIEETAKSFLKAGSQWIHLIDLQGAEEGTPRHLSVIRRLKAAGLLVQYGGGLRSEENIAAAFEAGADRLYLGSLLVKDRFLAGRVFDAYGPKIIPAVDIRDGDVVISGWKERGGISPEALLERLRAIGYRLFLVTAVHRDGTGSGPDREMYRRLLAYFPGIGIIAAGGLSSMEDVRNLREDGLEGIVLGKSIYEGSIILRDALREASSC
jgi:phosphoribosylformimino-5-aminoimidazole carboxamide ribotide isomerase